MQDEQGVVIAGEVHLHAVDVGNLNVAAAYARALHHALFAVVALIVNARRVRVGTRNILGHKFIGESALRRDAHGITEFLRPAVVAEYPCEDCIVRAVPPVGARKGTGELNACANDARIPGKFICDPPDSAGARRVRAGRTYHHRTDNIKNIHVFTPCGICSLFILPPLPVYHRASYFSA